MSLELRGKTWWYNIYIGKDYSVTPKRYRCSCGTSDKAKAEEIERTTKANLISNLPKERIIENLKAQLIDRKLSIEGIWEAFTANPNTNASYKHLMRLKQVVDDFVDYLKGTNPNCKDISGITNLIAQAYISCLQSHGKYNRTISFVRGNKEYHYENPTSQLSLRSIQFYLVGLKYVFRIIKEDYGLSFNPFEKIQLKNIKRNVVKREAFTPEELKIIGKELKESETYRWLYPVAITGISTGLRLSDICSLKWNEINFDKNCIAKKTSKTANEVIIPLLPPFKEYLLSLKRNSEHCYPELYETYLRNPIKISKEFTRFLKSVGIVSSIEVEGRSRNAQIKGIHSLRHTFCYIASVSGIPLNIVQSIVGHLTQDLTTHYSDHATNDIKLEMMKKVPNYLGGA